MQATIYGPDRFETQVYMAEGTGCFVSIDYSVKPSTRDWVVIPDSNPCGLAITPFRGQSFIGVVRVLHFYQLTQSDQAIPINLLVHPD